MPTNPIQLNRRVTGNAGAPAALKTAELAINMVDDILYIGYGDDGNGNATSVIALAGPGVAIHKSGPQTIDGIKTFSASPIAPTPVGGDNSTKVATTAFVQAAMVGFGAGDMSKATYDTTDNGKVDLAELADAVPWSGVTGKPTSFTPAVHGHAIGDITGLQSALDLKAPIASPDFTGVPTAPTAAGGTNSTQLATTAFVAAAIAALIDGAPGAIDTLNELAAALGDDPNFATTVTNGLAAKLAIAANLSDLNDIPTARGNLGLASMALQASDSVAITGGTIDNVTIDGGTF